MSDFFDKLKKGKEKVQQFGNEQKQAAHAAPLPLMMLNDGLPLLTVVAYILLGSLGGWWHPAWLVFFILPIYYMMAQAIIHKSLELVPIAPIVVAVYLCLGCIGGMWHPYWAIFAAIPLYYMMVAVIKGANWTKIFDILVPIITVAVYLVLGLTPLHAWHPGWVVFFAIPLYYTWRGTMMKYKGIHKNDYPEQEEPAPSHVEDDTPDDQR
ncbi:MAG: hypothetical protein IK048_05170 [Clostridia bacterium]|nr:hypothetical protein [Clostridia bacterium]